MSFGGYLKKQGFTYIEVLIALTISAAIFSAVFPLLFTSITTNRSAKLKLIAYEAASNQIEQLRERKIASLVAPSDNPFSVPEIPASSGVTNITRPLSDSNIVRVKVTINWPMRGNTEKIEMTTYLYGSTN